MDGMGIQVAIVLAGVKSTILLFHKEERGGLGGLRWMNLP